MGGWSILAFLLSNSDPQTTETRTRLFQHLLMTKEERRTANRFSTSSHTADNVPPLHSAHHCPPVDPNLSHKCRKNPGVSSRRKSLAQHEHDPA
ncbi:Modification methylase MboIA [Clarias magur]|uniref:Modification methylase MboIA n=1 Tax=Clarias magur TaxID=1594786 RepID=A0A8J4X486_CLAMG|nr:Modification methylase MboIA [Clarias magur]